jgi:general secretion pathway protein K
MWAGQAESLAAGRERGFALLIVLWSLVLISLLTTQLLASGRTALTLASNLRAAAMARASADGAINEAVFHLLQRGPEQWRPDGAVHALDEDGVTMNVRIESLGGEINPNRASTKLLAGLFESAGASPNQARLLAGAIIAWRSPAVTKAQTQALLAEYQRAGLRYGPPGRGFADLSELGNVMGMTPALMAAAMPDMSLYQSGDPDPKLADEAVRRALILSGQVGSSSTVYEGTAPVVTIIAQDAGPAQGGVSRTAIVSLTGLSGAASFSILSLTNG